MKAVCAKNNGLPIVGTEGRVNLSFRRGAQRQRVKRFL